MFLRGFIIAMQPEVSESGDKWSKIDNILRTSLKTQSIIIEGGCSTLRKQSSKITYPNARSWKPKAKYTRR